MIQYHQHLKLEPNIVIKKRHFIIVISILLLGFIVGTFLDLQINEALFQKDHWFSLTMASFGVYPCYAGLAFLGGGFLSTTLKRKDLPMYGRIICYFLAGLAYVMSVYLCAREWPSENGFNNDVYTLPSYLISAFLFAGVFVGAFFLCKKGDAKKLWIVLAVMIAIWVAALLPAGFLIKLIVHRPRYRYAVRGGLVEYKEWWRMFPNYKDFVSTKEKPIFIEGFEITKEEYKSFPSGHSGTGMIMSMFLPFAGYFFPKIKGREIWLYYIGVAYGFVMMFSRMLSGAHYLTDTCMGSLFVMISFFVFHEIAFAKGWISKDDNAVKETNLEETAQQEK